MGINGLIPFVKPCTEAIDIKRLSGKKVAIDSYCWLHKGAIGCAGQLVLGEDTDNYVTYCMKLINLLRSNNITVIMVFDGRNLPAKAREEKSRLEARNSAKKMIAQYLRLGQLDLAKRNMARSIDVTHAMALRLIQACHKIGVDCIVAPYEADAQLAYLSVNKIVDYVITEDSDLILFGCPKIIFKLNTDGIGVLFENKNLHLTMQMSETDWNFSLFRRMCILSGCDYLPSLYGVGLVKAKQFVVKSRSVDFSEAITKINKYIKISLTEIPQDYIDKFLKAEATFMYQYVYDPEKRRQVRLTELPPETPEELLTESGAMWDAEEGFQHALGNLDPITLKKVDDWNPDNPNIKLPRSSIWNKHIPSIHSFNCIRKSPKKEPLLSQNITVKLDDILKLYCQPTIKKVINKRKFEELDYSENSVESSSAHANINPFSNKKIFPSTSNCCNTRDDNESSQLLIESSSNKLLHLSLENNTFIEKKIKDKQLSPVFKRRKPIKSSFLKQTNTSNSSGETISSFFKKKDLNVSEISEKLEKENIKINSMSDQTCDVNKKITENILIEVTNVDNEKLSESLLSDIIDEENDALNRLILNNSSDSSVQDPSENDNKQKDCMKNIQSKSNTRLRPELSKNVPRSGTLKQQSLLETFGFYKKSMPKHK